jgi:hypothetical protein
VVVVVVVLRKLVTVMTFLFILLLGEGEVLGALWSILGTVFTDPIGHPCESSYDFQMLKKIAHAYIPFPDPLTRRHQLDKGIRFDPFPDVAFLHVVSVRSWLTRHHQRNHIDLINFIRNTPYQLQAKPHPSLPHRNHRPIPRATSNSHMLRPRLLIPALQLAKRLQHPDRNIIRLRQRILLAQANSRPAAERQVAPSGAQRRVFPALRAENVGVRAVDGFLAHGRVGVVEELGAFGDEERLEAVFAAAVGEDGVFDGEFLEQWGGGVEAEDWGGVSENLFSVW